MNATIKANMHSEISRTIMISNNLSHCSYKYTCSCQSVRPDFRVQANALAVVLTMRRWKMEKRRSEGDLLEEV